MSSSQTKPIYRNPNWKPGHAGQSPIVKRTLDTHAVNRIGRAGTVSGPVRSRAFGKRAASLSLLLVLLLLAVIFIASSSGKASAQGIVSPKPWCQVSAPTLPARAGDELECIKPRVFIPIVQK